MRARQALLGCVLVLDDNEAIRGLLRDVLEAEGHAVHATDSGKEALGIIRRRPIDVVLLDLAMPKLNGGQFLMHLRQVETEIRPTAVVITGDLQAHSAEALRALGATVILEKPFSVKKILETVAHVCEERKHAQAANTVPTQLPPSGPDRTRCHNPPSDGGGQKDKLSPASTDAPGMGA